MAAFVGVTNRTSGKLVFVNLDRVDTIVPVEDGANIFLAGDEDGAYVPAKEKVWDIISPSRVREIG